MQPLWRVLADPWNSMADPCLDEEHCHVLRILALDVESSNSAVEKVMQALALCCAKEVELFPESCFNLPNLIFRTEMTYCPMFKTLFWTMDRQ